MVIGTEWMFMPVELQHYACIGLTSSFFPLRPSFHSLKGVEVGKKKAMQRKKHVRREDLLTTCLVYHVARRTVMTVNVYFSDSSSARLYGT